MLHAGPRASPTPVCPPGLDHGETLTNGSVQHTTPGELCLRQGGPRNSDQRKRKSRVTPGGRGQDAALEVQKGFGCLLRANIWP
jgi:hypothetical protein